MDIPLTTADGHTLAGTLTEAARHNGCAVLVNAGMGVRRGYYQPFADYLAEQGFHVLTYDYRGMGDSRNGALRGTRITMLDWAAHDQTAALDGLSARYPGAKLCVVGHSLGGQIVGLSPAGVRVHRLLGVAAQRGYWRLWQGAGRLRLVVLWFVLIPALARVMGYFPGRRFGLGEDLPAAVTLDWARAGGMPGYFRDYYGGSQYDHYDGVRAAVRLLSFADDDFAPHNAVEALRGFYPNAQTEHHHVRPAEVGAERIGHSGFFRRTFRDTLWAQSAAWLAQG